MLADLICATTEVQNTEATRPANGRREGIGGRSANPKLGLIWLSGDGRPMWVTDRRQAVSTRIGSQQG